MMDILNTDFPIVVDFVIVPSIVVDGVIYDKEVINLILYPRRRLVSRLEIPTTVIKIGDDAFINCSLSSFTMETEIVLPDGLNEIGVSAFAYSGIVSLQLPNSVKVVGKNVFWTCRQMEYINIPIGVERIGALAFASCYDLVIHCERPSYPKIQVMAVGS
ncbi:MAG: leucine-rich repeat domain-containing protein [Firmicutes bacterium]|nr:leucine-rich repeat domain-containing protein [Bacillota bacterium]